MLRAAYRVLGRNRGQSECTSVHSKVQPLVEVSKSKNLALEIFSGGCTQMGDEEISNEFETVTASFRVFKGLVVLISQPIRLIETRSYAES